MGEVHSPSSAMEGLSSSSNGLWQQAGHTSGFPCVSLSQSGEARGSEPAFPFECFIPTARLGLHRRPSSPLRCAGLVHGGSSARRAPRARPPAASHCGLQPSATPGASLPCLILPQQAGWSLWGLPRPVSCRWGVAVSGPPAFLVHFQTSCSVFTW